MAYTPYHKVEIDFTCNAEGGCGKSKTYEIQCARDADKGNATIERFIKRKGWRVKVPNLLCPVCNKKEKRNAENSIHTETV